MPEELELVDEHGRVVGRALRSACHGDPSLVHRSVHVLVFNREGQLYLQRRAAAKDIEPGKWDTSVGGHVDPGESWEQAARREMQEELGIEAGLSFLHEYVWGSEVETERVRTYKTVHDGPIRLHPDEIEEGRFWTMSEIQASLGAGLFTPNFEEEFSRYLLSAAHML